MKRFLILIYGILLVGTFAACGGGQIESEDDAAIILLPPVENDETPLPGWLWENRKKAYSAILWGYAQKPLEDVI